MYESLILESCLLCKGSGFITNNLRDLYINDINADLDKKAPYICCNYCLGTGKQEYEKVLNIICCTK
jgi:RecJ-like exonuclease